VNRAAVQRQVSPSAGAVASLCQSCLELFDDLALALDHLLAQPVDTAFFTARDIRLAIALLGGGDDKGPGRISRSAPGSERHVPRSLFGWNRFTDGVRYDDQHVVGQRSAEI
jgi:hypothetical protein